MDYILSLSYFDLPHLLRSCLLYLTLFPEDYEIERLRLVHIWISEGLIRGEDGKDPVELGDAYFHELVNRSLIQPVHVGYDGKAQSCRVHDTILDFLICKSADENFCALLRGHPKLTQDAVDGRVRRLSLMGSFDDGGGVNIVFDKWNAPRVRSLVILEDVKELPSFSNMSALRVLDATWCYKLTDRHVQDITRLHQLRYWNICGSHETSKLPREIGDLQYLETLVLPDVDSLEVPASIIRLRRLERLYISRGAKFPDGIEKMKKLRVFEDITMDKQSLTFLQGLGELTYLKKLRITLGGISFMERDNKLVSRNEKLVQSLRKLEACSLRNLCLTLHLHLGESDGVVEDVSFPALSSIKEVYMYGEQPICRFTKWFVSLTNLQKLLLNAQDIEQHDLEMVGRLPSMLELTLVIRGNRVVDPIVITGGGFQQLRGFQLGREGTYDTAQNLWVWPKIKGLIFEVGAMPKLKELSMDYDLKSAAGCFELGIQHLSSLAWLRVEIDCRGVRAADVAAAEGAFKTMADTHASHPVTLQTTRGHLNEMLPADDS